MNEQWQIEVRDSLAEVPAEQWNALSEDGNPFTRYEFLFGLETTQCVGSEKGWYPRYFLLWNTADATELLAAVPAYLKTHSYGEFVFDWSWAEAFENNGLSYYPKLVSSIPYTPATGRRFLIRPDQKIKDVTIMMAAAMRQLCESEGYSGAHWLFVTESESDILKQLEEDVSVVQEDEHGETDESAPKKTIKQQLYMERLDCQYHWHNKDYADFDSFLQICTSKRRKTIRRERRHVNDEGLTLERRLGSTLSEEEWGWVHQFYSSTYDRKWGSPMLTLDFFKRMGATFGENTLIVFAHDPGEEDPAWPVACSIMFIGGDTLYGRFWGCRREYNSLHFETCYYQGIEHCIENNISHFEPGAQGEHKITRGFEPKLTRSLHYISHPGFRNAIANFLVNETQYMEQRCNGLADLLPFKEEPLTL